MLGIGRGQARADPRAPRGERIAEFAGAGGLAGGEIVFLSGISSEIVEFEHVAFKELDELPIAPTERAGGSAVVVVRQVPVEGIPGKRRGGIAQVRSETHAVLRLRGGQSGTAQFDQGRIDVVRDGRSP